MWTPSARIEIGDDCKTSAWTSNTFFRCLPAALQVCTLKTLLCIRCRCLALVWPSTPACAENAGLLPCDHCRRCGNNHATLFLRCFHHHVRRVEYANDGRGELDTKWYVDEIVLGAAVCRRGSKLAALRSCAHRSDCVPLSPRRHNILPGLNSCSDLSRPAH